MQHLKLKILLAAVLALQLTTTLAASAADRITVTVRGKGPDIVLIPGLACSSAVWDATAKQLEEHYRLHLVQIAGFGSTNAGANASGPVLQPTVEAIDLYIKTNHLKSPSIVGHSTGGLMGMMLAIQHPDEVGKLMIVDSMPFLGVLMGATDATNAQPQAAGLRDMILNETQDAYAQGEKDFLGNMVKSPEGLKSATAWAIASDKSVIGRAIYDVMTTDLRPDLKKIKAPVTLLYPWDSDSGFPRDATDKLYHDSFATLPSAKVVCIEDSRHFIMLDQPAKFAAQLDAFLKP
jgi:pimeloyl-ACP methyl ester carboxylesterase